jgi:uncharacterized protein YlzI (FlbEa/FlbD family)
MEFTEEQKLFTEIVQKAWEDAEFKKELVANPIVAIEKLSGKKLNLPEGKKIVVRDQTDESVIYINIPVAANHSVDKQLSEEQLEAVAGGVGDIAIWPPITTLPKWPPIICFPPPTQEEF